MFVLQPVLLLYFLKLVNGLWWIFLQSCMLHKDVVVWFRWLIEDFFGKIHKVKRIKLVLQPGGTSLVLSVLRVLCYCWQHWWPYDTRSLCPPKPWWAALGLCYSSTMYTNYSYISVSDVLAFAFYVQKQLLLLARLSHHNSVCLSVLLSVTQVDQSKTVQDRTTKSSPTLVSRTVKLFHKFKEGHAKRGR